MTPRPPAFDRPITELLKERFTLSVEIVPPRNGSSPQQIYAQIETFAASGADFMAVTKGAGGSLRGGTLPIAQVIKDQFGLPCMAHFTCRDLLPEDVENQLVDHHFLGVRNILALRGDPPIGVTAGSALESREGSHLYAHQLVDQIANLNRGKYLCRPRLATVHCESTSFCIGVACYPDQPDRISRVEHLKMKVDAGAEFAVSQMLLGSESYERFLEECAKAQISIPILPGTCVFRSQEQVQKLSLKFGLHFEQSKIAKLPKSDLDAQNCPELVVENFVHNVDSYRRSGAPGLHAFLIGSENQMASQALEAAHQKNPARSVA